MHGEVIGEKWLDLRECISMWLGRVERMVAAVYSLSSCLPRLKLFCMTTTLGHTLQYPKTEAILAILVLQMCGIANFLHSRWRHLFILDFPSMLWECTLVGCARWSRNDNHGILFSHLVIL